MGEALQYRYKDQEFLAQPDRLAGESMMSSWRPPELITARFSSNPNSQALLPVSQQPISLTLFPTSLP